MDYCWNQRQGWSWRGETTEQTKAAERVEVTREAGWMAEKGPKTYSNRSNEYNDTSGGVKHKLPAAATCSGPVQSSVLHVT